MFKLFLFFEAAAAHSILPGPETVQSRETLRGHAGMPTLDIGTANLGTRVPDE